MSMHKEFEVHLLNPEGVAKAKRLAEVFDEALTQIEALAVVHLDWPREMAMHAVCTHLEIASFYAKKAMASLPENQK
jgi:hypothetical protein